MSTDKPTLAAVEGVVFKRSPLMLGCTIVAGVGAFFLVVGLVFAKYIRPPEDPDAPHVVVVGTLVGLLLVLGIPSYVYYAFRKNWVPQRLIIGSDRLQIVETKKQVDTVVLQIPFANIASFVQEATPTQLRLGIDVRDVNDADTISLNENFEANKLALGRHLIIVEYCFGKLSEIQGELEKSVQKWKVM